MEICPVDTSTTDPVSENSCMIDEELVEEWDESASYYVAETPPEIDVCYAETERLVPAIFTSPGTEAVGEVQIPDLFDIKLDPGMDYKFYKIHDESIYYVEFSSMDIQVNAFLRMAMFLESDVNAGRVLNDEQVEAAVRENPRERGIGYDFTTKDICRFYNEAKKRGVKLNHLEEKIKSDLVRLGVIRFNGKIFIPLQDSAVISAAQDSYARRSTIEHEYRHGFYMTDPFIREEVDKVWNSLSEDQQSQMRKAIRALGNFDVENKYLLLNELYACTLDWTSGLSTMPFNKAGIEAFQRLETEFDGMEFRRIRQRIYQRALPQLLKRTISKMKAERP